MIEIQGFVNKCSDNELDHGFMMIRDVGDTFHACMHVHSTVLKELKRVTPPS